MQKYQPTSEPINFEKVWAMFQETDRKFQETDHKFQDTDKQIKETGRELNETMKATDKQKKNLASKSVGWQINLAASTKGF